MLTIARIAAISLAVVVTLVGPSDGVVVGATSQLVATPGCVKGSPFSSKSSYSVLTSVWGHASTRGGWRGAVLGPDGDKVYGIPCNATSVLEVDPVTRSITTFGQLGEEHSDAECSGAVHCGDEKWIGGVLIPGSGKIIGIPYAAETVLEIDPVSRSTSTFGTISSSVRRKWVDGVLARNGLVYAIPFDADVILEINPDTRTLVLFGRVGTEPCKWYGGVLGPNGKIYGIPYSSTYVLEIDPDRRLASPFAVALRGHDRLQAGKWSGGVLAPDGKIYAMPALAKSVLEIDIDAEQTRVHGMLPGGSDLQDKWSGGTLAPNGKIYATPWRSSKVLEFDPSTKAIALLHNTFGSANFSWGGAVLASSGKVIAVPYNSPWVLEIGLWVCGSSTPNEAQAEIPPPVDLLSVPSAEVDHAASIDGAGMSTAPVSNWNRPAALRKSKTLVLALPGCPDESSLLPPFNYRFPLSSVDQTCFHLNLRTWHSAMMIVVQPDSTLLDMRKQIALTRLSQFPAAFCFLYDGQPFDPSVEASVKAASVAVAWPPASDAQQYIVLIDNLHHCNIGPVATDTFTTSTLKSFSFTIWFGVLVLLLVLGGVLAIIGCCFLVRTRGQRHGKYDCVPTNEQQEIDKPHTRMQTSVPSVQAPRLRLTMLKALGKSMASNAKMHTSHA